MFYTKTVVSILKFNSSQIYQMTCLTNILWWLPSVNFLKHIRQLPLFNLCQFSYKKNTKHFIISTIPFISHFQIYFSETKYDCFSFLHIRVSEAFRLGQKRPQKFWSGAYLLFSQKCVVFTRICKWVRISLIELSWTTNNDDITCIILFAVNWWCGNGC